VTKIRSLNFVAHFLVLEIADSQGGNSGFLYFK